MCVLTGFLAVVVEESEVKFETEAEVLDGGGGFVDSLEELSLAGK